MTAVAIADVPRSLLRRKGTIIASGVVAACLALAVAKVLPASYAAESSFLVTSRSANGDFDTASRVDVLLSNAFIYRVVRDLHLDQSTALVPAWRLPPAMARWLQQANDQVHTLVKSVAGASPPSAPPDLSDTVDYVKKRLSVTSKDRSGVVTLEFRAGTAELAAAVVNALVAQYLDGETTARVEQTERVDTLMNQQAVALHDDLAAAEQRLAQFIREHALPEVQGTSAVALQLSRDEEQLALARQEVVKRQAELDSGQRPAAAAASSEEALASRTVSSLKQTEAQARLRMAELAADSRRQPLQDSVNGIRAMIDNEVALIAASMTRAVQTARAKVQALEQVVSKDREAVQRVAIETATLAQLRSEVTEKRNLYATLLTSTQQGRLALAQNGPTQLLSTALPPTRPQQTPATLAVILGFMVGSIASGGLVVVRSILSPRIHTTDAMAALTGMPAFGSLPEARRGKGNILVDRRTAALVTETFRALWVSLRSPTQGTTVVVTSSDIGEGKTTLAFAFARRVARDGASVLLIDGDLRRPRLASLLGQTPAHALEDVLNGSVPPDNALCFDLSTGLHCLLARGGTSNPVRALTANRFAEMLERYKATYDLIIIDSPPVLHVIDAIMVAKQCDHVLFVVQSDRMSVAQVSEATHRFPKDDRAKVLTILNRVRGHSLDRRDYYSGYAA